MFTQRTAGWTKASQQGLTANNSHLPWTNLWGVLAGSLEFGADWLRITSGCVIFLREHMQTIRPIGIEAALTFVILAAGADGLRAQTNTSPPVMAYSLLTGSQLVDDCPICDRVPIAVAMTGTFHLQFRLANPLFGTYDLSAISFHAANAAGSQYAVTGSGTYEYGGLAGSIQNARLSLTIDRGSQQTVGYFTNSGNVTGLAWPNIQTNVEQTNGTPSQVYHLRIIAVPVPQITAILPDPHTGNVLVQWLGNGQTDQVERADSAAGPYAPLSPLTSDQSFTDLGVLTNRLQFFYRLRQWP